MKKWKCKSGYRIKLNKAAAELGRKGGEAAANTPREISAEQQERMYAKRWPKQYKARKRREK